MTSLKHKPLMKRYDLSSTYARVPDDMYRRQTYGKNAYTSSSSQILSPLSERRKHHQRKPGGKARPKTAMRPARRLPSLRTQNHRHPLQRQHQPRGCQALPRRQRSRQKSTVSLASSRSTRAARSSYACLTASSWTYVHFLDTRFIYNLYNNSYAYVQVTAATQPSFLQHAVYVDSANKRLSVLGEVNRRFVVTPDIDSLLAGMELADNPPTFELGEGLLTMDTT